MNEHIIEYLDYYITLDNPQYAVMLIGNWGCGKTYFIKDLIDKWDESTEDNDKITLKPIYICLNGINDTNKINDKIRAAISPILYSKGMQVAKTIFKGFLKSTAKIDFSSSEIILDKDSVNIHICIPFK